MKIYSEKLNKLFNTVEECEKAEHQAAVTEARAKEEKERAEAEAKAKKEKEAAERKAAAAELDEARKAMVAAQKHYAELLDNFIKKYKSYHYTTNSIADIPTLFDSLNLFNLL